MERIDSLWLGTGPLVSGGFRIDSEMIRVDSNPLTKSYKTFERTLNRFQGLVRQPTKYRFYRTWVTVKPVDSAKSCRPKANSATKMLLRPTVQKNEPVRL
ncbi:hypothetical protein PIB30_039468 [Stylosanthes scabra]|uniref:Uncharacterized protein n=1 Tax=Stylosanthes scabra TaxID=79078 RepID=A0ABU6WFG1_9FABA|nr:hypothetical protein [Stylosanthes scabra]